MAALQIKQSSSWYAALPYTVLNYKPNGRADELTPTSVPRKSQFVMAAKKTMRS